MAILIYLLTSKRNCSLLMDPQTTALILVGYQNDYFAPNGVLRGAVEDPERVDLVLANSLELLAVLQGTTTAVVATPFLMEEGYRGQANSVGILDKIKSAGAFKPDSWGAATIPELLAFGERITYIPGKAGFNAFTHTELDRVLRERGIENVLVAGMVTSLCVDSTGRAAYELGYGVTILSDCCSARTPTEQEFFCERIFPLYASVLTKDQVIEQMRLGVMC